MRARAGQGGKSHPQHRIRPPATICALVRTRGDANAARDPWTARLNGGTAWQVRAVVPKAGWAIVWLRTPAIRRFAIFAVPLLLALLGLWRIWQAPSGGEEEEARDATRAAPLV